MDPSEKLLLRAALDIHAQLGQRQSPLSEISLPTDGWERCRRLQRQAVLAQQHGWRLASARCRRDLRTVILNLQQQLSSLAEQIQPATETPATVTRGGLFHDLLALRNEFDDVRVDRDAGTVSVTTEPIVLEGVFLGPFQIKVDWTDLAGGHPADYRVIALDPNPAASDHSVTHPHVHDESVCEGDGRLAIRTALAQGRLFDFFTLVANVLRTYNPGSPYAPLDQWDGVECRDCGAHVDPDEWYSCYRCGVTMCCGCYVRCRDCDDDFCLECVQRCEQCDDYYCNQCLRTCADCRDDVCSGCLENNERCETCHANATEEETTTESGNTAASAGAPVQSDRLGQAAVPVQLR